MNILLDLIQGKFNFVDAKGNKVSDTETLANMIKSLLELQLFYEKITKGNSTRAA